MSASGSPADPQARPAEARRGLRTADQITTGLLIVICVAYLIYAAQLPQQAGLVPSIIGGATLVIAIVQLLATWIPPLRALRGEEVDEEEGEVFRDPRLRRRFLVVIASLVALPVLALLIGLPLALPVYVALFTLVDRQRWFAVLASTAVVAGLAYGVLVALLGMPLAGGLLGDLL